MGSKSKGRNMPEVAQKMWEEYVAKEKIHEMIKGLQAEKEKLQILHRVEADSGFTEFVTQEAAKKRTERRESDPQEAEVDEELNDQGHHSSATAARRPTPNRIQLKGARTTAEVLTKKRTLTDQQFEDILNLCEDKIEQKALREAYIEKKARERYLENAGESRIWLYNCLNSKYFVNFMLITIIINITGMFALTFDAVSNRYSWGILMMDSGIIGIFLAEAIMKIIIYKEDYFKHVWNLLDMLIIIVHFAEISWNLLKRAGIYTLGSSEAYKFYVEIWFNLLKSLRVLRLLRVIKFLPSLQVIVTTLFQSMVSIGSIAVLMLLFMCVFTVIARGLFGNIRPSKFGSVILAFVTLFQLLTLDNWFDVLQGTKGDKKFDMDERDDFLQYMLLFFYLFWYLVIEYFVFLNLFVAVLVDNFQLTMTDVEIQKQKEAMEEAEALQKFEYLRLELVEAGLKDMEHDQHLSEMQEAGLHAEDYFQIDKDSPETEHLSELFKNMNSLDFERFIWKRRFTIFNGINDTALNQRMLIPGEVERMEERNENDDE